MDYDILKSLHIISIICWYAGLFYLPRIFVYHAENSTKNEATQIFKVMEKKLFYYIMTPAMVLSYIFGLLMLSQNMGLLTSGFNAFHIKLTAVIVLTLYHFSLEYFRRALNNNKFLFSSKFFRIYNEIPTILLFVIIFSVIYY